MDMQNILEIITYTDSTTEYRKTSWWFTDAFIILSFLFGQWISRTTPAICPDWFSEGGICFSPKHGPICTSWNKRCLGSSEFRYTPDNQHHYSADKSCWVHTSHIRYWFL